MGVGGNTLHLALCSAVWFCLARLTEDIHPLAVHDSSLNPQTDYMQAKSQAARAVSMTQHFLSQQARELPVCFPGWGFS